MEPYNPILDQPQSIEYDEIDLAATYRLANQDVSFSVDAKTDLYDFFWPWADHRYVRSIKLRITDARDDALMALVTRYYEGYQETILGNEGMIISKRVAVPLGSNYDRAALWMLECQAEGDRLMRLDVTIDWGEPLTQRIVDGLLVAQLNPQQAQGIYQQKNADSTRVFGNPYGRPSTVEFDGEGHATLVYYVLINGIVEVPLILTVSDVGEQVAWNGFLALRDAERAFELSTREWEKKLKTGRLWTSDPGLNRVVHAGKLATLRHLQRLRTGVAPTDRRVVDVPALVRSLDTCDLILSRNLLANLRRVAEKSGGRLPVLLPLRHKDPIPDPGDAVAQTNTAYLRGLHHHCRRHPDVELLAQHYQAVQLCAETLVQLPMRLRESSGTVEVMDRQTGACLLAGSVGLRHAVSLATLQRDSVNAVRWESEACELERLGREAGALDDAGEQLLLSQWETRSGWQVSKDRPWAFLDPLLGVMLAGEAIWEGCGIRWRKGELCVNPAQGNEWDWWAVLDLPLGEDESISLVWDGKTLHSTRPVQSDIPVNVYAEIVAAGTDEHDFDLHFKLKDAEAGATDSTSEDTDEPLEHIFRPKFDQGSDANSSTS